jgi:diguanylate cyclase (GGDEF)-like protein/PAS domain S-box-containing protein
MSTDPKIEQSTGPLAEPGTLTLLKVVATVLLVTGMVLVPIQLSTTNHEIRLGALILIASGILMHILLRGRRLRWAVHLMCWSCMAAGFAGAYASSGLESVGMVALPLSTMAGGWLLGRRAVTLMAAAGLGSALVLYWLHQHGHVFSPFYSLTALLIIHMAIIITSALVGYASAGNARRQMTSAQEARAHLAAIIDSTSDMIWAVDPRSFRILSFNAGFRDFMLHKHGIRLETGMRFEDLPIGNEATERWLEFYRRALSEGPFSTEYEADGGSTVFSMSFNVLQRNGEVFGISVFCRDVTERKAVEEQIRTLAYFDPLTHLTNRRLLMDRLGQALTAGNRNQEFGALILLDLDHFKKLNDTQGHDVGDRLLVEVARLLTSIVRQEDTVSRLGGDEFVVLIEGLGKEERLAAVQAEVVAEKMRHVVSEPHALGEPTADYHNTCSIGVTLFRGQDASVDVLLKQADVALYQAKDAGRDAVRFFNPAMQIQIDARIAMENAMRQGLGRGEFKLYYQPQVDQEGNRIGAEALIRWLHFDRGVVSPAEFITLAEETGLILDLGQWVLDTACAQLKRWESDPGLRLLQIAVNVSPRQFHQPDFVERIRKSLGASGANPNRLILELTESIVLENVEGVIARMETLNSLGVLFSLDDFGTGYSSLAYLKRLPLGQVKIDRTFVRDIAHDLNDAAIVQAILAMSRSLGVNVIAEGVETQSQWEFLLRNGCMSFQGYLFDRPMPIEDWSKQPCAI